MDDGKETRKFSAEELEEVQRRLAEAKDREDKVLALERQVDDLKNQLDMSEDLLAQARGEAKRYHDEAEQLQVQIAGCIVAAEGNATGENDATAGMYGHSVAFDIVKDLRRKYEQQADTIGRIERELVNIAGRPACDLCGCVGDHGCMGLRHGSLQWQIKQLQAENSELRGERADPTFALVVMECMERAVEARKGASNAAFEMRTRLKDAEKTILELRAKIAEAE
jgi:DNA repair exonuclease SbcCD ATPase subunit